MCENECSRHERLPMNKTANKQTEPDIAAAEKMLEALDRSLAEIETNEILSGRTAEELVEMGFIGEGELRVRRIRQGSRDPVRGFIFLRDVDYMLHPAVQSLADIDLARIDSLDEISPDSPVAQVKLPEQTAQKSVEELYIASYIGTCGFTITRDGNSVLFTPQVQGRLVIAGDLLYLVPSDRDGSFTVRLSDDRMKVFLDVYPPAKSGRTVEPGAVKKELNRLKIKRGILGDAIEKALDLAVGDAGAQMGVLVAQGVEATDGQDAPVEWFFDTEPVVEGFRVLPDGRVDYRAQANIQIVHQGDLLARLGSPVPGINGYDVLGNILEARPGSGAVLCAGNNVVCSQSGEFRAECDGQVTLNDTVLNVFEHYLVDGDVDFGCGNIDFTGNVTIRGGVLPGFEVKADGDILIMKSVEGATLKAGRDIRVQGGVIGAAQALITCGRDMYALHVNNAQIEAQRDVHVANSIVQSRVYCGATLMLKGKKSTIVGGHACALDGIHAVYIGSEYGSRTVVEAGNDFVVQKKKAELDAAIAFCIENIGKIDRSFLSVKAVLAKGVVLSEDKRERIKAVQAKRAELVKYRAVMESKRGALASRIACNWAATICAEHTLYPDVLVKIATAQKLIREPLHRVRLSYDATKECFREGSL